jgi:hypothetical protein
MALHVPNAGRPMPAIPLARSADCDRRLEQLRTAAEQLDDLHSTIAVDVVRARVAGASWRELGAALGISHRTCWNRYAPAAVRGDQGAEDAA